MKPYNLKDAAVEIAISMSADHNGAMLDMRDYKNALITAEWAGANATDGYFTVEISNTGTSNWETYPGSGFYVTTASGFHHWDWPKRAIPFIRLVFSHGTNSAGLYAVTAWMEE